MFKTINKNAGQPKKLPLRILHKNNSKCLVSKKQKKANVVARAVKQTQRNPKYNKKHNFDNKLSGLFIWEQYEVPEIKQK